MTLSTTDSRFAYNGDASTTAFSFPRKFVSTSDLKVVLTDEDDGSEAPQTLNTHYTVSGAGLSNGVYASGTVTFVAAPGTDKKVIIYRDPALTQEFDFTAETEPLTALNRRCDLLMMEVQRLQDQASRSMRKSEGFWSTLDMTLPDIDGTDAAAGYVPMLATGLTTMTWGAVADGTGFTVSSAMAAVVQSASLALGRSAFGLGEEDSVFFYLAGAYGVYSQAEGASDVAPYFFRNSAGLTRWAVWKNGTTEGGADAGADFELKSYTDAGAVKSTIFRVTRSTGVLTFLIGPALGTPASGDLSNCTGLPVAGGGTGFALLQGADIASATTTDIGAATGPYVHITGTTTITGLGTIAAGHRRTVKFTGALTLTHNGTSLILPASANITTAANDTAEFASLGSGNWVCLWYKRASGLYLGTAPITQGGTGGVTAQAACANLSAWHILGASAAQSAHTGNTSETVLATITVPANAMGANGVLRLEYSVSMTNNANNKTIRVRLGGVGGAAFKGLVRASTLADRQIVTIQNVNATGSQKSWNSGSESLGVTAGAFTTGAIDTTASQTLVITGQLANSADSIAVESYVAELLYRA